MLYTYKCTNETCNHVSYINHSMEDTKKRKCPICNSDLRKLFSNANPIYKSKGFYNTDYD